MLQMTTFHHPRTQRTPCDHWSVSDVDHAQHEPTYLFDLIWTQLRVQLRPCQESYEQNLVSPISAAMERFGDKDDFTSAVLAQQDRLVLSGVNLHSGFVL